MAIRESIGDNRTIALPFPALQAVAIGDLLFWDATNLVGKPASLRADQGSLVGNQRDFALVFLGVSGDQRLAAETSTGNDARRMVTLDGFFDCDCPSQSFEVNDLVGIDRNAAVPGNYNQQVNKVTNPAIAIGSVVQRTGGVAVTRVRCRLTSQMAIFSLMGWGQSHDVGGMQGQGGTVLADGNVVMDASYNPTLSMTPTVGRNINLPPNALSQGLVYYFTNNAGGAISVTFLSSAGAAIKGNGVVPQGKSAYLWYDAGQSSWVGLVSA